MLQTDSQPRWQRRADERPQELLDAALELFVERGFSATRLEDVAKRAGVSKGTVYLYFASKEDLFKVLVHRAIVPELERAEALVCEHSGSNRDLLARLIKFWWRSIAWSKLSGIPKLVLSEAGNFPEIAQFFEETVIRRQRALLQGVLAAGMDNGEFRRLPADLAARIVTAPLLFGVLWKHSFLPLEQPPLDLDSYCATALDVVMEGLQERKVR